MKNNHANRISKLKIGAARHLEILEEARLQVHAGIVTWSRVNAAWNYIYNNSTEGQRERYDNLRQPEIPLSEERYTVIHILRTMRWQS
jgi:hypothetical protein